MNAADASYNATDDDTGPGLLAGRRLEPRAAGIGSRRLHVVLFGIAPVSLGWLLAPVGFHAFSVWLPIFVMMLGAGVVAVHRLLLAPLAATVKACRAARVVAESSADVIVRCDAAWRRIYVSAACIEVVGYTANEMLYGHALGLVHPDDRLYVAAILRGLGAHASRSSAVFRMLRKDRLYAWMEARYRYLPGDGGFVAVLRDISVRKRVEELLADTNERLESANVTLEALAAQDGLTGLANRRQFDRMLDIEFRRAARLEIPIGLVLIDVDRFKGYNDRYGHPAGDDCLRAVSQAIQAMLRRGGEQAARYGGEEIAVLLPGTDEAGAREMAERVAEAVRALVIVHGDSPCGVVTVSAGVSAAVPAKGATPRALVEAADQALYLAKASGRNCVQVYSPTQPITDALNGGYLPSM